ncbi:MAG: hypothetical protein PSY14_00205 [bacterium]|nr:hypothetical protein [bacterium]
MKNVFNDIAANPGLTAEQRVTQMAAALDALLPQDPWEAQGQDLLQPYLDFKQSLTTCFKAAKDAHQELMNSSLVVHVGVLWADASAGGLDANVAPDSPLRQKAGMIRKMLGEERQKHASVIKPNAQLTEAYKSIIAVEEKTPRLSATILAESKSALQLLGNMRDPLFRTSIQDSVETILNNAEFVLYGVESYQQSEREKSAFRSHLKSGLSTEKTLNASQTARFRRR